MKRILASEFLFQLFALLLSLIVVHTVYVALVWPNAQAVMKAQAERIAAGDTTAQPQSLYVILKDYEQESEVILFLNPDTRLFANSLATPLKLLQQPTNSEGKEWGFH